MTPEEYLDGSELGAAVLDRVRHVPSACGDVEVADWLREAGDAAG